MKGYVRVMCVWVPEAGQMNSSSKNESTENFVKNFSVKVVQVYIGTSEGILEMSFSESLNHSTIDSESFIHLDIVNVVM